METRWPRGTVTGPVLLRGTCGGKQEKGGKRAKEAKEGFGEDPTPLCVSSPHTAHIQRSTWGTARLVSRRTPRVGGSPHHLSHIPSLGLLSCLLSHRGLSLVNIQSIHRPRALFMEGLFIAVSSLISFFLSISPFLSVRSPAVAQALGFDYI